MNTVSNVFQTLCIFRKRQLKTLLIIFVISGIFYGGSLFALLQATPSQGKCCENNLV